MNEVLQIVLGVISIIAMLFLAFSRFTKGKALIAILENTKEERKKIEQELQLIKEQHRVLGERNTNEGKKIEQELQLIKEQHRVLGERNTNEGKKIEQELQLIEEQHRVLSDRNADFDALVTSLDTKFSSYLDYFFLEGDSSGTYRSHDLRTTPSFQHNTGARVSLFEYRRTHYSAEKQIICERFVDEFFKNTDFKKYKKVFLMLDSGSTIYPIFQLLCNAYSNEKFETALKHENGETEIEIITNNLPGMRMLLESGRKGNDVNAEMKFKCHALPGLLEGKYGATLSRESVTHMLLLRNILYEHNRDSLFISVISGNYISVQDGILWRGEYHGAMKDAMIECSDQVYILSPIGKIFNLSANGFNELIDNSKIPLAPKNKVYKTLKNVEKNERREGKLNPFYLAKELESSRITRLIPEKLIGSKDDVHLITTNRRNMKGIYPPNMSEYFNDIQSKVEEKFEGTNVIYENFSPERHSEQAIYQLRKYADEKIAFLNYEFPHPEVRGEMEAWLFPSANPPSKPPSSPPTSPTSPRKKTPSKPSIPKT